MKKSWVYLLFCLGTLGAGMGAGLLTRNGMETYGQLNQPPLSPPGVVFPIVWAVLYLLMGVSAARVYLAPGPLAARKRGLRLWGVQLAVNLGWSFLFFAGGLYLAAFLWLILLWGLILGMIRAFWQVDCPAAWLQLPYLGWVTFAGYLNAGVWLLNR